MEDRETWRIEEAWKGHREGNEECRKKAAETIAGMKIENLVGAKSPEEVPSI